MFSVRRVSGWMLVLLVFQSCLAEPESALLDRVEVAGGAVLIGQIEKIDGGFLSLNTEYAGQLQVELEKIEQVTLAIQRDLSLPPDIPVFAGTHPNLVAPERIRQKPKAASVEEPPPRGWTFEGGINLTGKQGNSERMDIALVLEAELEREFDRVNLYTRYSYGTNRGVRSSDELILGGRYTSFFYEKIGIFVRQETEQDEFEGIKLRTTAAAGMTRRIRNEEDLRLEARAGISYRYEDYIDDGTDDFPGMDIGLEVDWRFVDWARFRGTYTFLPSISNLDDFIIEQDSGFNVPLDDEEFWKLRFGVTSQYNNDPDQGRERLDLRYYARFIASWE